MEQPPAQHQCQAEHGDQARHRQESKERRRRERRERRARRQQRRETSGRDTNMLLQCHQLYADTCHALPDLLVPPPPYTTLPRPGPRPHTWRASFPRFTRRSQNPDAEAGTQPPPPPEEPRDSKSCCGVTVSQTVSIRWFIVMIAFVGICCAVVGTVLGAMKASGREHLTVSLLMIGVGIVLITVSGIAWRLTAQDGPSCRAMLGLAPHTEYQDGRFLARPPGAPRGVAGAGGVAGTHPYSGMMYSEFQYRPPPPSYQASMQEYRLRLLLMDRGTSAAQLPPPPPVMSPPPAYRSGRSAPGPHSLGPGSVVSRPPSYRSRASELPAAVHARQASHLSQFSHLSGLEPALEAAEVGAEDKAESPHPGPHHASVVSVIPCSGNKAMVRISADMDQYMSNIQDQFGSQQQLVVKEKDCVTIVQARPSPGPSAAPCPVVVTVSGAVAQQQEAANTSQGKVDITAHL